jgi:hypothetical protein
MRNTRIPTDTNLGLTFTNHIFVYWFHFFKFFVVYYITISIIEKVPEMSIFFYFFFELKKKGSKSSPRHRVNLPSF